VIPARKALFHIALPDSVKSHRPQILGHVTINNNRHFAIRVHLPKFIGIDQTIGKAGINAIIGQGQVLQGTIKQIAHSPMIVGPRWLFCSLFFFLLSRRCQRLVGASLPAQPTVDR
jgi:hypothetical protein